MTFTIGTKISSGKVSIKPDVFEEIIRKRMENDPEIFIFQPKNNILSRLNYGTITPKIIISPNYEENKTDNEEVGTISPKSIEVTLKMAMYYDKDLAKEAKRIENEVKREVKAWTGVVVTKVNIVVTKLIKISSRQKEKIFRN